MLWTALLVRITHGSDKTETSSVFMGRGITNSQKEDAVTAQGWEELIAALKLYASTVNCLQIHLKYSDSENQTSNSSKFKHLYSEN